MPGWATPLSWKQRCPRSTHPHVHEEIHDTPIIDEAALPVFGNNWFVMDYLKKGEIENTAAYIAWLLKVTKGYGVKLVNPGGTAAWGWGLNCLSLDDPVPYFDITPAEIITGLHQSQRIPRSAPLDPHPPERSREPRQLHGYHRLAQACRRDQAKNKFGREQVMHSTHLQFHSYGGDSLG